MNLAPLRRARESIRRHGSLRDMLRRLIRILRDEGINGVHFRLRHLMHSYSSSPSPSTAVRMRHPPQSKTTANLGAELSPGALLVGHPFAVLGRAEDIRTCARAMDSVGIPFAIRNLHGEYGHQWLGYHKHFPLMQRVDSLTAFRANIFVLNANEMESAWRLQGDKLFAGRYNIGYWAWELSRFPQAWMSALSGLDEIWAPSRFIQQSIAETTETPVYWMPLAVEPTLAATATKESLGLPKNKFLFLFFFDFRAFTERKNPWGAVRAFNMAFKPSNTRVGLVIKINGMQEKKSEYHNFLNSKLLANSRLTIIDRVMEDWEVSSLVNHCDCFISLHRSEGFGRGLAEAMFMAKPVIATGYSGNLDFMNQANSCLVDCQLVPVGKKDYPYGEGQVWAEPDLEMASHLMVRLVEDPALARKIGHAGADYIRQYHSFAAIGARYRRRLESLHLI